MMNIQTNVKMRTWGNISHLATSDARFSLSIAECFSNGIWICKCTTSSLGLQRKHSFSSSFVGRTVAVKSQRWRMAEVWRRPVVIITHEMLGYSSRRVFSAVNRKLRLPQKWTIEDWNGRTSADFWSWDWRVRKWRTGRLIPAELSLATSSVPCSSACYQNKKWATSQIEIILKLLSFFVGLFFFSMTASLLYSNDWSEVEHLWEVVEREKR